MGTQVIPTHRTGATVIDLVKEARQRVVLVTPYWKPWGHLDEAIKQAARGGAAVEVVFCQNHTGN